MEKLRDISRCEWFSELVGGNVPCDYPDHERCSCHNYTDKEGIIRRLCGSLVKDLGIKKVLETVKVLLE